MTTRRIQLGSLYPSTLGFDQFFDEIEKQFSGATQSTSFPPHNIIKLSDNEYVVELAIAGFSKDDVDITVVDGQLLIKGHKADDENVSKYIYKGIGARSFSKSIKLADTVIVQGASMVDGILKVSLVNVIPESKKPIKITIGDKPVKGATLRDLLVE